MIETGSKRPAATLKQMTQDGIKDVDLTASIFDHGASAASRLLAA